jgi:O-antigen ligase
MKVVYSPGGAGLRSDSAGATRQEPRSLALGIVYAAWALFLFEPEWFLASFGLGFLKRIGLLMFPFLAAIALSRRGRPLIYWPLAVFLVLHTVVLPFVTNRGYAMEPWKLILQMLALYAASLATIDSVRRAQPLMMMFLLHFGWWALHGLPQGRVLWHYTLANEDGYGPLMGMGLGFASFVALGASAKRPRRIAAIIAGLCGIGVVASLARGAFLAGALVLVMIWLRSPRKVAMAGAILLMGIMILIAAEVLFPGGGYWAEMMTISDGYDDPTGGDRRKIWNAGWKVFLRAPLLGVGANNFGSYASETFGWGEGEGHYADPGHLYGRSMHNIYYQLLAEQGLLGSLVFLWILVDFVRRNRALRQPQVVQWWSRTSGGRYDLLTVSLGLEAALVAYLANGYFYDQLYTIHPYAIFGLNLVLWGITRGGLTAPTSERGWPARQPVRVNGGPQRVAGPPG